jgi:glycosyltransferase involved in cell wall biosynthesis
MVPRRNIIFASEITSEPWGGSEELWSRAALDLASQGIPVSASIAEWSPIHPRVRDLRAGGVELWVRPGLYSWQRDFSRWLISAVNRATTAAICLSRGQFGVRKLLTWRQGKTPFSFARLVSARPPALAVLNSIGALPPIDLVEFCAANNVPFVTIGQANWEGEWYIDKIAARYRAGLCSALRCFFVSEGNLRQTEMHIGAPLPNAEIVRNPVNIPYDTSPAWPPLGESGELRFACVGRLSPPHKGQDILLEVLAQPTWQERSWRLYFYGDGPMREGIERLADRLGILDRVVFAGFRSVEEIWAANHVLLMPSRREGLPLAMVEAMLCGRPVVATDVAGHAEIVEDGITGYLADAPTVGSFGAAMERFWERRGEAEVIGKAGARRIRELVPPDPARVFAERLKTLAGFGTLHGAR